MKNYRTAFLFAIGANVLLLLALGLGGAWRYGRVRRAPASPPATVGATSSSSLASESAAAMPSSAAPPLAPAPPPLAPFQLSPQRLQSIGVTTALVERKSVHDEIRVVGNVAIDERKQAYVQTRFSGWIHQVFVDAAYQHVRRGQPLFTIYSPALVTTEREYLLAKQNAQTLALSTVPGVAQGADSLLAATLARLRHWDLPSREIRSLESTGMVRENLEIDSPVSGFVTERNALANLYVEPSTRLYTIADLSTVWVFAQAFQNDLGRIGVGDSATLTVDTYPGRTFPGRVDFIYPEIDMSTRTARVRLVFANSALKLTPGMFVNVDLKIPMGEHLVIPAAGVLQSGTRQIAFVDHGGGDLEPRDVQLGARVGDNFIVVKGLKAGERIVTSANFLIDSESQLQAALGSFTPPPPGAGAAGAMNAPKSNAELTAVPSPPRKGRNAIRVKLTEANGSPLTGAEVTVIFFMPAMPAMGMSAMRVQSTLSEKGGGNYEGAIQLGTGGAWQVTILAKKNGQVVASKQMNLRAAGGM